MSFHGMRNNDRDEDVTTTLIRQTLRRAKVLSLNIAGGPGCGKTTLILQTLARLAHKMHVGVITANSLLNPNSQQFAALAEQVAEVETGPDTELSAEKVRIAIQRLNLGLLNLLLIENNTTLSSANQHDLGESKRVIVFSVAAGAHMARKYAELVRWADAVIINKLDLLTPASFDLEAFRDDIKLLNPSAEVFEISAIGGEGLGKWISWLNGLMGQTSIAVTVPPQLTERS